MLAYSGWSWACDSRENRRSAGDFAVRQYKPSRALTSAVAHFGSVRTLRSTRQFFRCVKPCYTDADRGERLAGQFLAAGQGPVAGGLIAGDHRWVGVRAAVVEAGEAQIGDRAEPGRTELGGEFVVPAGGDLRGPSGPHRADSCQTHLVVDECDHEQSVACVPAGVVLPHTAQWGWGWGWGVGWVGVALCGLFE